MKRSLGLTLPEMAVALALTGVLALGAALLVTQGARAWQLGQVLLEAQTDYADLRRHLGEDVRRARAARVENGGQRLRLEGAAGRVCYYLEGGRVYRDPRGGCRSGTPLTLLEGYAGRFSAQGRSVRFVLTRTPAEGLTLPPIEATRRVLYP
ncbi:PulJ/GspJ family protein [Marinithermus hydrothermalis]|uniref:Prepilin-type N-terminal cleavage/methylation domain-containing protein n=1 Tax=Marinithermus hydrothermalis (strain DSM 14884 / JCM 11576 / T1) TaxID=869210 RepID=F2NLT3_MARHT|nr:prepilin-type N-terminal cleavage/methylation domain-containing protein [Marinithermus hydrothermalis]AEB10913.1 hypothetical protein Marky_0150 [Marinithermus hydrothermalis DSM 14884]